MSEPFTPGAGGVKGEVTTLELSRAERSLARRSAETRATVPSVELGCQVEMDACLKLAGEQRAQPLSIVLAILARRLRESPRLNGAYRDGRYELYSRVNLGIVLPGPEQPLIATLFGAAELSIHELDAELAGLTQRAASGQLSAAELSGSTFTVTPPGPPGVTLLTPLILPPQAAAMSLGAWRESPVVRAGSLIVAQSSQLTLACDHRIVQAHAAAEFLATVRQALEEAAL
ncbi:MAG TPA: 2-oxo acid dehydrogenase subunit E2 [Solirubrobacteraceae bacterium]|nr:2-oxo acid dehydrogenase subunit E2 [Solirubrobacteraceae bacterium]